MGSEPIASLAMRSFLYQVRANFTVAHSETPFASIVGLLLLAMRKISGLAIGMEHLARLPRSLKDYGSSGKCKCKTNCCLYTVAGVMCLGL